MQLLDDAGDLVERYAYDPYGNRTVYQPVDGTDSWCLAPGRYSARVQVAGQSQPYGLCEIGFQGLPGLPGGHDEAIDTVDNRARVYLPPLGRFAQTDPLGYPDGLNPYAAYHVMWGGVDPWGLDSSLGRFEYDNGDGVDEVVHADGSRTLHVYKKQGFLARVTLFSDQGNGYLGSIPVPAGAGASGKETGTYPVFTQRFWIITLMTMFSLAAPVGGGWNPADNVQPSALPSSARQTADCGWRLGGGLPTPAHAKACSPYAANVAAD